jgi:hypothetical protein
MSELPASDITADDHDLYGYPHGVEVLFRGEKRPCFFEHEGDHVVIWWFPGDAATNGPDNATEAEKSNIYELLWAWLEGYWSWDPEDFR